MRMLSIDSTWYQQVIRRMRSKPTSDGVVRVDVSRSATHFVATGEGREGVALVDDRAALGVRLGVEEFAFLGVKARPHDRDDCIRPTLGII